MYRSKITHQGQITIPKVLRDQLGWREGDDVMFLQDDGKLSLQALPRRSLNEVADLLPGLEAKVPYNSFEELLELEKQSARDQREQRNIKR